MVENCKTLLLGGTADGVGKSFVAAGLGRIFARRGLLVAPFKAEERSGHTLPLPGGGEIGYATALQAAACGLEPHIDMNPLLLKPKGADVSQLWLQGRLRGSLSDGEFLSCKADLLPLLRQSCRRLQAQVELLLIEGSGNLAESGLLASDSGDLKVAGTAPTAVILLADAERGGAFASLIGTVELLSATERAQLRGVIINKGPADRSRLSAGIEQLEKRTGLPLLGIVPRLDLQLEKIDDAGSDERKTGPGVRVGVVQLPYADSAGLAAVLEQETDLQLETVAAADQLEGLSLLLVPDSESVHDDLNFLQQSGLTAAIRAYYAAGGRVVGVGGGFHLLAEKIDGPQGRSKGLALLDLDIQQATERRTRQAHARFQQAAYAVGFGGLADVDACLVEVAACGYGVTSRPLLQLTACSERAGWGNEGAVSADGRVWGTGLRDLLAVAGVRYALLAPLRAGRIAGSEANSSRQKFADELDRLAEELEKCLDLTQLCSCLDV